MQRFVQSVAGVLVLVSAAGAQEKSSFIKPPIFVFQPGVVTANAISATDVGPGDEKVASGLNVRFATIVPTASPYFLGIAGVQFQPNGLSGNHNNQPGFFYGGVVPLPGITTASQGWLGFSIDPLGVYAPSSYSNSHPYSHDFFLEGALTLNIGSKMMKDMPMFSKLSAYFLLDQQITHPAKDRTNKTDRFNPVILYGVTLPISPM